MSNNLSTVSTSEIDYKPFEFHIEWYILPYTGRPALLRLLHILRTTSSDELKADARNIFNRRLRWLVPDYKLHIAIVDILNEACGEERTITADEISKLQAATEDVLKPAQRALQAVREMKTLGRPSSTLLSERLYDLAEAYASVGELQLAHNFFDQMKLESPTLAGRKVCGIVKMYLSNGRVMEEDDSPKLITLIRAWKKEAHAAQEKETKIPPNHRSAELSLALILLDLITALSLLAAGEFVRAGSRLRSIGIQRGEPIDSLLAPRDIAIYAILCSLATPPPSSALKSLRDSESFRILLREPSLKFMSHMINAGLEGKADIVADMVIQDLFVYDPFLSEIGQPLAEAIITNTKLRRSSNTPSTSAA